jgi:agmatine deiminase
MSNSPWQLLPEWHPQLGVLVAWPHEGTDWQAHLEQARDTYLHLIAATVTRQTVWLVVPNEQSEAQFWQLWQKHTQSSLAPEGLKLIIAGYNDTWLRDTGPLSLGHKPHVKSDAKLKLLSFQFNGWGNKFPHALDNQLAETLWKEKAFCHPLLDSSEFENVPITCEGGNLDTNGAGVLLTQAPCLLNENRNTNLTAEEWTKIAQKHLGISRTWWLDYGQIAGDDTDGHIDTLARFCGHNHIVYQSCDEADYPFAESLADMAKQLKGWTSDPAHQINGEPLRLTALPWPDPLYSADGERLPATYANFLIINDAVLMPTYGVAQDRPALDTLASCFPDREVIGIPCRPLITQGGSLHCITMQISAPCG